MKILLFGKSGQIGWELQRSLATLGEVIALGSHDEDMCGDFTNLEGIAQTVRAVQPDVIVNAAAYTAVDQVEQAFDLAYVVNARAPQVLAEEAGKIGALLVHYSTDYVFDGSGTVPWREGDMPNPISLYGKTKLDAESLIQASGCKHLIFRTSWVYAARGHNFAKTMLKLAKERDFLEVVNDQIGAPTGAELVADATAHAVRLTMARPELSGLYHLVASGEVSWHGYASFVIDYARKRGLDMKVSVDAIRAVGSDAFKAPAKRPLNCRLETSKLQQTFNINLPHWQSGVIRMLDEFLER
jgi:dTDP-4-dehydrorhamnose reductase